ncbi:MAG: response regulator transcription factor, partial [Acidimicrobiales bacterium]|nr:response regulator transcription factor [Acidimicrobiales bacterium]
MTTDPIQTRRRLLVVDDDPVARDFAALALSFHDTDVDQAVDPLEAIDLLRARTYEAVIVDLDLPHCSGVTLMGRIRQIQDLPIMMLTSHDDSMVSVTALEAGADEFCIKPLVERELALRVDLAIERHGRRRPTEPSPDDEPSASLDVIISAGEWQSVDTVAEHVYRLRQKLDESDDGRSWIQTVRGAGYRFDRRRADAA